MKSFFVLSLRTFCHYFCATKETDQQLKVLLLKATWQAMKNRKMSGIEWNQKQNYILNKQHKKLSFDFRYPKRFIWNTMFTKSFDSLPCFF